MLSKIIIITLYALLTLLVGLYVKRRNHTEGYFLAERNLNTFQFIATMVATNLSAFTVFGASGAGYRCGMPFFLVMGFGTGFMSLAFIIVGRKIWRLGKDNYLITPAQLIGRIYSHKSVAVIFSVVLLVFTLPYVALQPYAAGKILHNIFNLPTWLGATLTTAAIILYTMRGGLKAVVVTDILQGTLMFLLLFVSFVLVCQYHGGFYKAFSKLYEVKSGLLSFSGSGYSPILYLSFIMLWFYCDPLFPQLFQRFYAARSEKQIVRCAIVYPLICLVIFFFPVAIGAMGNITFPDLLRNESDSIMALLLTHIAGDVFGTLVLTAGIAALMSTFDSQLLTLSSIFTHDILPLLSGGSKKIRLSDIALSRVAVVLIALCGLAIALLSDTTLLQLGMTTFIGLGVLFPTLFLGLYLPQASSLAAVVSIVAGEFLTLLLHYKILVFSFMPAAAFILLFTTLIYLMVYFIIRREQNVFCGIKKRVLMTALIIFAFPLVVVYLLPHSRWFFAYLALPGILQSSLSWLWLRKMG